MTPEQRSILKSYGAEKVRRLPNNEAVADLAEKGLIDVYWVNGDDTVFAKILQLGREAAAR